MTREAITRYFVQQGSSQDLRVSDEDGWYVIRQAWQDAHSAIHRCEIEIKCAGRVEAQEFADKLNLNSQEQTLRGLSHLTGQSYNTLIRAARQGRLSARKSGNHYLSTVRAVEYAIETGAMRAPKDK